MKYSSYFLRRLVVGAGFLSLLLFAGQRALSMVVESGSSIVIDRPVFEDLYLAGGTITVNAPVHGDLVVAGGTVYINDTVDHDILVIGGRVELIGYMGGKVRCMGGDLRITRSIHGDLVLAGGTLTIEKGSTVAGSLLASGGDLIVNGVVQGNVRSAAGRFWLRGAVGGFLDCRGGNIEIDGSVADSAVLAASGTLDIGANAAFGGPVRYWAPGAVEFGSSMKNGKAVVDESLAIARNHWYYLGGISLLWLLAYLGAGLVEIIVLQSLFASILRRAAERSSSDTLRSLGAGFLFVCAVPVLAVICLISVIGIPIAVILFFGYITAWLFCSALIALVVTNRLNNRRGNAWRFWRIVWTAFAFFVLLKIAFMIPVLGWLLVAVLACIAYGAVLLDIKWRKRLTVAAVLLLCVPLMYSCEPSVKLTAAWSDRNVQPARFNKLLVVSLGKDLAKRKLGEDHIKAELERHGLAAVASLDEFGPDFAKKDSLQMRQLLLDRQFDGVITIRVLSINEHDRWVPGTGYYGPIGYYRGFYGYFYRVWGYYDEPGYTVTDVEVLLESNLYRSATGELLWSGQSKAFNRNPTDAMAARYARNIVEDMIGKGVLIAPR